MRSVTEQAALDEFLTTAELAGTDFTAEKLNNVKIIHADQRNPYLLSAQEETSAARKHHANRDRLTIPRRPQWDENTTPKELDSREKASLMDWRRDLAELQENNDLLMTPFERNLEVWRQLWRVIERSDLVVQIVDARNPLLFRSEDLEKYVKEVDSRKNNLVLVNKADMMTLTQREAWADYFESAGINYKFFSAHLARELNDGDESEVETENEEPEPATSDVSPEDAIAQETAKMDLQDRQEEASAWETEENIDSEPPRTRILTVSELESLFLAHAPSPSPDSLHKTQIGLVGYPNVGKSSTINALLGAKKVSVSATPGKTKHFQTIHLSPRIILCDCPGLVFPNFAITKAELVCAGVLPVDQMREFTGPVGLVAQRIPKAELERAYGIRIPVRPDEEGGTGVPTAAELLGAYARARGFSTQGLGQPDEARASRYVLKDYVNGKLLFCHPPPREPPIDAAAFNAELYEVEGGEDIDGEPVSEVADDASMTTTETAAVPMRQGPKSRTLDRSFFGPGGVAQGHLSSPYQFRNGANGKQLTGRKMRAMVALERGMDVSDVRSGGKKHFKGGKKGKPSGGARLDEESR